jgi:hypothetical protein
MACLNHQVCGVLDLASVRWAGRVKTARARPAKGQAVRILPDPPVLICGNIDGHPPSAGQIGLPCFSMPGQSVTEANTSARQVGPPSSTTSISASNAVCHSGASASFLGSAVM